jgi:hypothetical protein
MSSDRIDRAGLLKNNLTQNIEPQIDNAHRRFRDLHEKERWENTHLKPGVVDAMMGWFFHALGKISSFSHPIFREARARVNEHEPVTNIDSLPARDAIPIIINRISAKCTALVDEIMDVIPEYEWVEPNTNLTPGEIDWLRAKIVEWTRELNRPVEGTGQLHGARTWLPKHEEFVQRRVSKYVKILKDRNTSVSQGDSTLPQKVRIPPPGHHLDRYLLHGV